MKFGYSFWGFVGDHKEDKHGNELSTPDGNAAYSWAVVHEALRKNWQVYRMQQDRDYPAFQRHGVYDFAAFSQRDRLHAYLGMRNTIDPITGRHLPLPELDILLLEWRMRIPGRNIDVSSDHPNYQPDLDRQNELLEHYSRTGTQIVIWDLDHKLSYEDEISLSNIGENGRVLETSTILSEQLVPRMRVEFPIPFQALLQHTPRPLNPKKKLVYVGSRYERDDVIDEWIKPVSERFPREVHFYGNWTRPEILREAVQMWPHVEYHGRITMKDFYEAYGDAVACPLLAKKSYLESGFMTPRIWEALIFGTIPVGLASHYGIGQYLPKELIAHDAVHLGEIVEGLARKNAAEREGIRREIAQQIRFMDSHNFIQKLESVV